MFNKFKAFWTHDIVNRLKIPFHIPILLLSILDG